MGTGDSGGMGGGEGPGGINEWQSMLLPKQPLHMRRESYGSVAWWVCELWRSMTYAQRYAYLPVNSTSVARDQWCWVRVEGLGYRVNSLHYGSHDGSHELYCICTAHEQTADPSVGWPCLSCVRLKLITFFAGCHGRLLALCAANISAG